MAPFHQIQRHPTSICRWTPALGFNAINIEFSASPWPERRNSEAYCAGHPRFGGIRCAIPPNHALDHFIRKGEPTSYELLSRDLGLNNPVARQADALTVTQAIR
jgi:hypothetical protein